MKRRKRVFYMTPRKKTKEDPGSAVSFVLPFTCHVLAHSTLIFKCRRENIRKLLGGVVKCGSEYMHYVWSLK